MKERGPGHVIVVGNEKGGCGKSTTAMHLAVGLMLEGLSVATIDLDIRQASLSRYVANRESYMRAIGKPVPLPEHFAGADVFSENGVLRDANDTAQRLGLLVAGARVNHDALVIDTPGSDTPLSRQAHSHADTLVTPINDSFVDLDVLGHIDARRKQVMGPSHYSEMVFEQRKARAARDGGEVDWIVVRNRLSTLDSHNTRDVEWALGQFSKRLGFRVIPGFSERVIFRELFLVGLTIMDLKEASGGQPLSYSHLAARQEVRTLVDSLRR